jgi:hypothetical protein
MFSNLEKELQSKFEQFKQDNELFYVDIDRELIYARYIDGFDTEELKQEHRCNCCKSFLRQFGGIVSIKNNKIVSIWDNLDVTNEYKQSVKNLSEYIHSLPVTSVFRSVSSKLGTKQNYDSKRDLFWEHFYIEVDKKYVVKTKDYDTIKSNINVEQGTLYRSLSELTIDASETVLELISQNSIYRGAEFKGLLENFLKIQKKFATLSESEKVNFTWVESRNANGATNKIRSSAIGTLLQDISNGEELDKAVASFERKVAPSNYKRTNSIVTTKQIELAEQKFIELGLMESLNRRYANESDIPMENVLFTNQENKFKSIFETLKDEAATIDVKKLSMVQEVSYKDFIEKVLPKCNSVEILFENRLQNNFVTLTTASNKETKSLMKWDNNFAWEYTNGVTDSIKERVKKAGGNVNGILRTSLSWYNYDDLDIHVVEPNGFEIYYSATHSNNGGALDVDMNAGSGNTRSAVENIIWTGRKVLDGVYTVKIHNFAKREDVDCGFELEVEFNGNIYNFTSKLSPRNREFSENLTFRIDRVKGTIEFINQPFQTESKEIKKWNLNSNKFHKVTKITYSPNYWNENTQVGNKHLFFFVENCLTDEKTRPFYNEFLSNELDTHRKSLDVLATKLKIEPCTSQISGFGFSETIKNSVILRVTGKTQRNIRVIF